MTKPHKPLGKPSYGSIPHLPNSRVGPSDSHISEGQAIIATQKKRDKHDTVIVQEKLDGSNMCVAKLNNQILALGRAGYLAKESPYKQHWLFDIWVTKNAARFDELLHEGERICGEWLAMAHGTLYNLQDEPFVGFDILSGTERIVFQEFSERCEKLDIVIPNTIHIGDSLSVESALEKLQVSGHGAIDEVEGAVWRVERHNKVDFLTKYVKPNKIDGAYFSEITGKDPVWNTNLFRYINAGIKPFRYS